MSMQKIHCHEFYCVRNENLLKYISEPKSQIAKTPTKQKEGIPNNALPCGSILVILFFYVHSDIMLLIQLIPVHEAVLVPTNGLQTHGISILLINDILKLQIVIKLTFAEILKKKKDW